MGLTHVAVKIRNFGNQEPGTTEESFVANFLVDTGATDSMAPGSELKRIGIKPTNKQTYELANGQREDYEVAFVEFSFMDANIISRIIFGPDDIEPILGAIALEYVGIVVDPANQKLKKLPALPLK